MGTVSCFDRDILAFTHIKKAAGTTISHILRINFILKHCDVKPLSKNSKDIFTTADMIKLFKINPFIKSIGGHSVVPFGDLKNNFNNTRFITLLRDPVQRYISQYQYNVEKLGSKRTFKEFLENKTSWNKQVRTIAGTEDLKTAKQILKKIFLLVGVVEEFDEFLILLKYKLQPFKFRPEYRIQNIGRRNSPVRRELDTQVKGYYKTIEKRNTLDIELYHFVKNELFPEEKKIYGPDFMHDVNKFKCKEKDYKNKSLWYIDYAMRKLYYRPLFRLIRRRNGFSV